MTLATDYLADQELWKVYVNEYNGLWAFDVKVEKDVVIRTNPIYESEDHALLSGAKAMLIWKQGRGGLGWPEGRSK